MKELFYLYKSSGKNREFEYKLQSDTAVVNIINDEIWY